MRCSKISNSRRLEKQKMDKKEFGLLVSQMRTQGFDDDKIMHVLYQVFLRGNCDIKDYELMVNWLGYSLSDEFYKDHGLKRK